MKERIGFKEEISFVMNGKPLSPKAEWKCPKCGVDRLKQPCPYNGDFAKCAMKADAQAK